MKKKFGRLGDWSSSRLGSWVFVALLLLVTMNARAQRTTDVLDRGLVSVKTNGGVYCTWRIMAEEYYDVTYNLYRDGTKVNSEPLTVSNYVDASGNTSSHYTVAAVVRGQEQTPCNVVSVWNESWLEIAPDHGSLTSTYVPNDACCADVDGDGELEILLKFDNASWAGTSYQRAGYNGEYFIIEVYKLDGRKLWWIDLGPNMADFQNNEQNIVAYDWDGDGKAEAVMRASDGTVIHAADGTEYVIGDKSKNYLGATSTGQWFVHQGDEFLVYMDGATGKPWQVMEYPLKRLEDNESDLNTAWGDGYGHRSTKHFFGAPYLDGRKPSIFLARGIYTRHKMIALDVNPQTHELTERWRWNCSQSGSAWYGNGYHNFAIADVDWDGRDEICFGSMVIDDNGHGLSTTGLGHGDAQHHSDFNPYVHGHEIFACNEDNPSNNYRDATTSKIYYRLAGGSDDGRCIAGNFTNDFPGAMAFSSHDEAISCVTNGHVSGLSKNGLTDNMRIYWDGDLLEECFNYTNGKNTAGGIYKYGKGLIKTLTGSMTNNDTKGTPCYQGDLFGDWREEVMMRTHDNKVRIYTTTDPTPWRNYTLWHDMQYRQAMVWQMCGYNQPPHASYFLGELEGITQAPPPLTMTNRVEVKNGGSIDNATYNFKEVILAETTDATVDIEQTSVSPAIFIDNAPSWVQGHDDNDNITTTYFTHTLTGGAFGGDMRLVKQGDGVLKLPRDAGQMYTGDTEVWAGTLVVGQGGLKDSHVWLNRFARLESYPDMWGQFPSVKAEYGSVVSPGGANGFSGFAISDLVLGFGSVLELDVYDKSLRPGYPDGISELGVDSLTIEKKNWQYGPKYDAPVLRIIPHFAEGQTVLPEGKYEIMQITWKLKGNLDDFTVEGLDGMKYTIKSETNADGFTRVYLVIEQTRSPETVVWDGGTDGIWDLANTENFKTGGGESELFVTGDDVTFNDNATNTDVVVVGELAPGSVTFDNTAKDFTLSGSGSIVGSTSLTKKGTANLTIQNINKYEGGTVIDGGTLTVSSLANTDGVEFGALGGTNAPITICNSGTLAVTDDVVSTQPIKLGTAGGFVSVPARKTLTENGAITQATKTALHKTGAGTLKIGGSSNFAALYLDQGSVQGGENGSSIHSYPDTLVLNTGTLRDPDNIYSYSTNNTTVVVPEGKKATWWLDSRCNYTGKLLGKGEISVVVTSVRCNMQGDWSQFEGTINFQQNKTGSYDPFIQWNNGKGLGKATVTGIFDNGGNDVTIGTLIGGTTLTGSGRYTAKHVDLQINKSRSGITCKTFKVENMLIIFEELNITATGYALKAGDYIELWEVGDLYAASATINLPPLPDGLAWDTSGLLNKRGVLRVIEAADGIMVNESATAPSTYYTVNGVKVEHPSQKGIYVRGGKKVVVK